MVIYIVRLIFTDSFELISDGCIHTCHMSIFTVYSMKNGLNKPLSMELQVFPKEHIESALKTVFQMNVMRYQGGFMGAVNGMRPDGRVSYIHCAYYSKQPFVSCIYFIGGLGPTVQSEISKIC